jgi:hypothetical protein
MAIPKKYFQDKMILFLLSVNVFLAFLCVVVVVLRLGLGQGANGYIVEYRSNLGLSAFRKGNVVPLFGFLLFPILALVTHTIISLRTFHLHRMLSVTILGLGSLLLILAIIVSNALLVLH